MFNNAFVNNQRQVKYCATRPRVVERRVGNYWSGLTWVGPVTRRHRWNRSLRA